MNRITRYNDTLRYANTKKKLRWPYWVTLALFFVSFIPVVGWVNVALIVPGIPLCGWLFAVTGKRQGNAPFVAVLFCIINTVIAGAVQFYYLGAGVY